MTTSYDKFDAFTKNISAYTLAHEGRVIGRVVFKHGAAVRCFFQIWGNEMVDARATGYGYDKATASGREAIAKLKAKDGDEKTVIDIITKLQDAEKAAHDGISFANIIGNAGFNLHVVI